MGQVMRVNEMDERLRETLLYDFYGDLLTGRQRQMYEDVIFNDLSYSEVAEENGISRQGVYDMVRRCGKILEGYEETLHLVEKFQQTRELADEICGLCDRLAGADEETVKEIRGIAERIRDL